jgi:hypothetical protein
LALTRVLEYRLRNHLQTIGIENLHDSEWDVIQLLAILGRIRKVLDDEKCIREERDPRSASDNEVLDFIKRIRSTLEGEA